MAQLPGAFDIFHDRISLNQKPRDRIESAANGLVIYLSGQYEVSPRRLFLQGSYPNDTAVAPEDSTGEYDVDLVCDVIGSRGSAAGALDDIEQRLAANGTYQQLLRGEQSRKKPCVRLFYAADECGAFHVDVVPARRCDCGNSYAPLEVPRRAEGWFDTAPQEYTRWCTTQGPRFARTVKMLKRWRDYNQDARKSIKSIVLQVLAANHLGDHASDAAALVATFQAIQGALAGHPDKAPRIENPVLPTENLAARWDDSSYKDFLKQLGTAVALAQMALAEGDEKASQDLWRELLGKDFPKHDVQTNQGVRMLATTPAPGHHRIQAVPRRNEYGL